MPDKQYQREAVYIYIYNTSKVQYMHDIKGEGHIPPQPVLIQSSGTPTQSHMTDDTWWAQEDVNNFELTIQEFLAHSYSVYNTRNWIAKQKRTYK